MKNPDPSIINQAWPTEDLERVDACLYCGSINRKLAHKDVRDWSFFNSPGSWSYWECEDCHALYLDPRPNRASIARAYATYYTHEAAQDSGIKQIIKKLKNECISSWLEVNLEPRFNLPVFLSPLLICLKPIITIPFGLLSLSQLPKGRLLDVGCGSGEMVGLAKMIGWDAMGLEIDPEAVKFARAQGLNVIQGGVDQLDDMQGGFDCIICSHVLEHVYEPITLLESITALLSENGTLLLSLPNASSSVRKSYGRFWRGLEAPRHISIPTLSLVVSLLNKLGYRNIHQVNSFGVTGPESKRMQKNREKLALLDIIIFRLKSIMGSSPSADESDFIQIIAKRSQM